MSTTKQDASTSDSLEERVAVLEREMAGFRSANQVEPFIFTSAVHYGKPVHITNRVSPLANVRIEPPVAYFHANRYIVTSPRELLGNFRHDATEAGEITLRLSAEESFNNENQTINWEVWGLIGTRPFSLAEGWQIMDLYLLIEFVNMSGHWEQLSHPREIHVYQSVEFVVSLHEGSVENAPIVQFDLGGLAGYSFDRNRNQEDPNGSFSRSNGPSNAHPSAPFYCPVTRDDIVLRIMMKLEARYSHANMTGRFSSGAKMSFSYAEFRSFTPALAVGLPRSNNVCGD